MNLIEISEHLAQQPRKGSQHTARWLDEWIYRTEQGSGYALVEGEEDRASAWVALGRLVAGRLKGEGGGPVHPIEAWMQAEVVAASVAAAHELETGEPVSTATQEHLRHAFTTFGVQDT